MRLLFQKQCPEKFSDTIIREHPVFSEFSRSFFSVLDPYFEEISYDSGVVFTCSGPGDALFGIIKYGLVDVKETIRDGLGENFQTITAGQSFGEANLVDPDFSILSCTVKDQASILIVRCENFRNFTGKHTRAANRFCLNLSNIISERLVDLNKEYISLQYAATVPGAPDS